MSEYCSTIIVELYPRSKVFKQLSKTCFVCTFVFTRFESLVHSSFLNVNMNQICWDYFFNRVSTVQEVTTSPLRIVCLQLSFNRNFI